MSIIAKGTKSLRKQDVAEQKTIALGFKKLVFAHQANAGETGINITSLVAPPDMTAKGFLNPPTSSLTQVNIYQNRNNLKIVSSLSGILIPYLSYTVNSSTYIAFNGFTAAQDEVFTCYLDEVPTTSLSVVDGTPIIASGTLLAGQTDFNIGVPIEINKYSTQQIGAVMVYVDRGLQYRKVGNVTGGDGDYIEVPVPGGLGSLIRFDAALVDRFVTVVSNGVVAERPDGSMTALIENVQGQIDQIVPTVAALAGVPETNFQISPNSVDLKQFGDKVITQETIINLMKTVSVPIVTNWVSYTPTASPSLNTTGAVGYWRRVGDSMQIQAYVRFTGIGGGGVFTLSMPVGYNADTSKFLAGDLHVGSGTYLNSGDSYYPITVDFNSPNSFKFTMFGQVFGGGYGNWFVASSSSTANDHISFVATVPIQGWTATQTIAEILGI
jgi:hypothetical protein